MIEVVVLQEDEQGGLGGALCECVCVCVVGGGGGGGGGGG